MSIIVNVTNKQRSIKLDKKKLCEMTAKLAEEVLQNLINAPPVHITLTQLRRIDEKGIINLIVVSNQFIQAVNKQWRDIDKVTDVLSFPLSVEASYADVPFELGEIIISAAKAHEQAADLGHGFDREMAFLFVHGLLHVLGFDHIEQAEQVAMFSRQREILSKAGYVR